MNTHRVGAYRSNWLAPVPPRAELSAVAAAPGYAADRYAAVPGNVLPAAFHSVTSHQARLSPGAAAQLQAMRAELTSLQAQLASLLSLVSASPAAAPPSALPLPSPVPTPVPNAFPWPAPVSIPVPSALPLPALAPPPVPNIAPLPAPALPSPPPVLPPTAAVPVPPPVVPGPQPNPVSPDALSFRGLVKGTRLMLAPGTTLRGFDVTGTAAVKNASPQALEMVVKGAAMFGMVRRTYGLRIEMLSGDRVSISLNQIGRNGKAKKQVYSGNLAVISRGSGEITLKGPDGRPASIRQGGDGSLTIQHPEGTVTFLVRGVAPLVAGVDDVDNNSPLA